MRDTEVIEAAEEQGLSMFSMAFGISSSQAQDKTGLRIRAR
jgi:hypothetical protein